MPDDTAAEKHSERSELGDRLRKRRKSRGLTMQDVADRAGLSIGFISQIERGLAAPSLSSLVALARVLQSEVSSFLDQPRGDSSATRQDQRPVYSIADNALSYERVSAAFPGNTLRSVIIHEPPGHRSEPISHEGEELFYIIQGAITVEVDGERTILQAGDTIHFPSTRTHSTWNHTDTPATILHTCTMDVFGDGDASLHDAGAHARIAVRRRGEAHQSNGAAGEEAGPMSDSSNKPPNREDQT